jgi:hypothetical protein
METKDVAILALMTYSIGLTTYTVLSSRRDKKPKAEAKLTVGFLTMGAVLSDTHLILEVFNTGDAPITISSSGLQFP